MDFTGGVSIRDGGGGYGDGGGGGGRGKVKEVVAEGYIRHLHLNNGTGQFFFLLKEKKQQLVLPFGFFVWAFSVRALFFLPFYYFYHFFF